MSSTNKTANYELSQYIGTDKPTYLGDYNSDMLKIDTGIKGAADDASTALSTANAAASTASDAATAASAATSTANTAKDTADNAKTTAESASTTAGAALTAAQNAQTAAAANTITNLAPAYDPTLTYEVGDLVTYIDDQGSGKLYKCVVAVTSPMAFNINYWDDVTTSEVYSRSLILVASSTGDGVMTCSEMLDALMSNVDVASITDLDNIKLVHTPTNGAPAWYRTSGYDPVANTITFNDASLGSDERTYISTIKLKTSGSETRYATIGAGSLYNYHNEGPNTSTLNDKFELYITK